MINKHSIDSEYLQKQFVDEVAKHGGHIINTACRESYLLVEAILPITDVLQKGDYIQGGVALYISPLQISVNNYLFRLICENGMLVSNDVDTHVIWKGGDIDMNQETIAILLKDKVAKSTDNDIFFDEINVLRSTLTKEVILLKEVLSLPRFSDDNHMLDDLLTHAILEDEDTAFGLINTITATARDEADPELRYKLQKIAGEIVRKTYREEGYVDFSHDVGQQTIQKMIA